jgi:phosphodiesterase/alkaline phosphatase D-like protein
VISTSGPAAAVRAFHEWLPTREPKMGHSGDSSGAASGDSIPSSFAYNRSVHFGDVASFHVLETRLTARTNPNANPSGNVWANLTAEIGKFAESSRAPAAWPGSPLETRIKAIKANLDVYRDEEKETMAGPAQLSWLADEVSASADGGVAWQVVAQASPSARI